jgi:hypothetical protein
MKSFGGASGEVTVKEGKGLEMGKLLLGLILYCDAWMDFQDLIESAPNLAGGNMSMLNTAFKPGRAAERAALTLDKVFKVSLTHLIPPV